MPACTRGQQRQAAQRAVSSYEVFRWTRFLLLLAAGLPPDLARVIVERLEWVIVVE
jgi:hypothetical protein